MSNKTITIDASADDTQNAEDIQHVQISNIKNDNSIESKNDDLLSEKENSELKKDIDDKSHRDNVKETHKKCYSENTTTGIGAYLRYEFTGLNAQDIEVKQDGTDKLPKYKEIDMVGYSGKDAYKKTKRRPEIYSRNIVRVQFMRSEILPEKKVLMEYEPEARNYTVKGMFVMLMITHFFAFVFTTALFISPTREGTILYGHLICIPCLVIFIVIVIIVACFGICRNAICTFCASFFACLFLSGFYGALGGYISKRIFSFNTCTLFIVDIFMIFLACSTYNFINKATYIIAIFTSIIGLIICIPGMEFYAKNNVYYWADPTFPQENWLSYLLTVVFTFITVAAEVAELQLLLNGEWVEIGENDYVFGGYLMFVSLVDYPIRFMRKRGWLASCDRSGGDDDEGGDD